MRPMSAESRQATSRVIAPSRLRITWSLSTALASVLVTACGTLATPTEVVQLRSPLSYQETTTLVVAMARKCWSTDVHPLKDGIRIETHRSESGDRFAVSGWRLDSDTGLAQDPFIVVRVKSKGDGAMVSVLEGDFGKGLTGPFRLDAATHVAGWLNGDQDCKPFATTLWHT